MSQFTERLHEIYGVTGKRSSSARYLPVSRETWDTYMKLVAARRVINRRGVLPPVMDRVDWDKAEDRALRWFTSDLSYKAVGREFGVSGQTIRVAVERIRYRRW